MSSIVNSGKSKKKIAPLTGFPNFYKLKVGLLLIFQKRFILVKRKAEFKYYSTKCGSNSPVNLKPHRKIILCSLKNERNVHFLLKACFSRLKRLFYFIFLQRIFKKKITKVSTELYSFEKDWYENVCTVNTGWKLSPASQVKQIIPLQRSP